VAAMTTSDYDEARAPEGARRWREDLVARGEAVPEGEELPPGATHELVEGEDGAPPKPRRRRYSIS